MSGQSSDQILILLGDAVEGDHIVCFQNKFGFIPDADQFLFKRAEQGNELISDLLQHLHFFNALFIPNFTALQKVLVQP